MLCQKKMPLLLTLPAQKKLQRGALAARTPLRRLARTRDALECCSREDHKRNLTWDFWDGKERAVSDASGGGLSSRLAKYRYSSQSVLSSASQDNLAILFDESSYSLEALMQSPPSIRGSSPSGTCGARPNRISTSRPNRISLDYPRPRRRRSLAGFGAGRGTSGSRSLSRSVARAVGAATSSASPASRRRRGRRRRGSGCRPR